MSDNLRDLLRFTDEQKQELRRRMMTDTLRDRIAAAVADEVTRQATRRNEYSFKYTPLDDEGNDLPELIGLDTSIDPAVVADAVIRELDGEFLDFGAFRRLDLWGLPALGVTAEGFGLRVECRVMLP